MEKLIESTVKARKTKKSIIPVRDLDLKSVSRMVSEKWFQYPKLMLIWTTVDDLKKCVDDYESMLNERTSTGNLRTGTVRDLSSLNKVIDEHLMYVKNYIEEEYGKEKASAHFAEFGIEHINKSYRFSRDGNQRQNALRLFLTALKAKNWKDKKYGVDFWTPLIEEYNTLYTATNSTSGTISKVVQDKNDCRKKIQGTLNGLILLIKANYPDTYSGELRNWGFQKEKY